MCVHPGNGLSTQRSGGPVKTAIFLWKTPEGCSLQQIGSDKPIVQWRPTGSALSSVHRLPSITGSSRCTEIVNSADETNLIFQTVIFNKIRGRGHEDGERGSSSDVLNMCLTASSRADFQQR